MAYLIEEQILFLYQHNISIDDVFDATEYPTKLYKSLMKECGYEVAIGVTPCGEAGHTMRTKHGACAQCRPEKLIFARRHHQTSEVYVAQCTEYIKIGIAADAESRVKNLNHSGYGGLYDWELIYKITVENSGEIEHELHKLLSPFEVRGKYYLRSGNVTQCHEIFSCLPEVALELLHTVITVYGK